VNSNTSLNNNFSPHQSSLSTTTTPVVSTTTSVNNTTPSGKQAGHISTRSVSHTDPNVAPGVGGGAPTAASLNQPASASTNRTRSATTLTHPHRNSTSSTSSNHHHTQLDAAPQSSASDQTLIKSEPIVSTTTQSSSSSSTASGEFKENDNNSSGAAGSAGTAAGGPGKIADSDDYEFKENGNGDEANAQVFKLNKKLVNSVQPTSPTSTTNSSSLNPSSIILSKGSKFFRKAFIYWAVKKYHLLFLIDNIGFL
jgi:hypothetical protein